MKLLCGVSSLGSQGFDTPPDVTEQPRGIRSHGFKLLRVPPLNHADCRTTPGSAAICHLRREDSEDLYEYDHE
jgi:hypothetical protein